MAIIIGNPHTQPKPKHVWVCACEKMSLNKPLSHKNAKQLENHQLSEYQANRGILEIVY